MAKAAKRKKLSEKQERFCQEYVVDLNATQAAIRAKYSKKTANPQGARLLANVSIQARIVELKAGIAERLGIEADDVVAEIKKLGFSNMKDFVTVTKDGMTIKPFEAVGREKLAAVESIKVVTKTERLGKKKTIEHTTTTFKLYDKLRALTELGKHLGIYEKDNQQKGKTLADIAALFGAAHANG